MQLANFILLAVWWDAHIIRWVVWVGLVLLTVALLLLIRTRWGQQPLGKCVVLSLVAHVLIAIYMTTVNIVTATSDSTEGEGVQVAIQDSSQQESTEELPAAEPWDALTGEAPTPIDAAELAPLPEAPALEPVAEPQRAAPGEALQAVGALPEVAPRDESAGAAVGGQERAGGAPDDQAAGGDRNQRTGRGRIDRPGTAAGAAD